MAQARVRRFWTDDQVAWLIALYPDNRACEVADALQRDAASVYAKANALGLYKSEEFKASPLASRLRRDDNPGVAFRFKKGQQAWNKGLHYQPGGRIKESQYKPGNISGRAAQLVVPIGSYRINSYGYLDRKISDTPGPQTLRWRAVHRLIWESVNGPVPRGHVVVFKNKLRTTVASEITLDRLELIARRELMRRNSYHLNYPKSVALAIQLKGALQRQINRRTKHAHD